MTIKRLILFLSILIATPALIGQEICDNGIDDDGDGQIDLNDKDCICLTTIPSGLIPNPSFEEWIRCPNGPSQLTGYAEDWIQASASTSDFVHTCGDFLGNSFANNASAPLPFPDGQGAIGFRDGNNNSSNSPNDKEYVGSVLTAPMEPGVTYKLDFFVGFHDHPSSRRFPMAFFLTEEAGNLPFGGNNRVFGCPTNGPGWDLVGELVVTGDNEWVNVEFEFTPDKAYEAIVLGPGCAEHPDWRDEPYFFMDRLVLAEVSEFLVPTDITGNVCDDLLTISLQPDQLGYQWYYEGVALVGQTERELSLTLDSEEGEYQAVVETSDGCFFSNPFFLEFPASVTEITEVLCYDETYTFGSRELTIPGIYRDTSLLGALCDSITVLDLQFLPESKSSSETVICSGETYVQDQKEFTQGGTHTYTIEDSKGCDSLITLLVVEVDTAVEYPGPTFELCPEELIEFGGEMIGAEGMHRDTIAVDTGCDSISIIEIIVNADSEVFIEKNLCPGESVAIESKTYESPGMYADTIPNAEGCDSLLYIEIAEVEGVEFLEVVDSLYIKLGESVDILSEASADVVAYEWKEDETIISEEEALTGIMPLDDTEFFLTVFNEEGCTEQRQVVIQVDKTVRVYIPDVMMPGLFGNEKFMIGNNEAVQSIKLLHVYDRWGELVYSYEGSISDYTGWDGRFNGKQVEQGVYTYVATFGIADGTEDLRSGNLTIIRN